MAPMFARIFRLFSFFAQEPKSKMQIILRDSPQYRHAVKQENLHVLDEYEDIAVLHKSTHRLARRSAHYLGFYLFFRARA